MINSRNIQDYIYDDILDLDKIVDDFSPYLKTIINNMVGNNLSIEDKEEILSDTFFILWKNRKLNILSLSAYLAGIVKNLVKEKLRKKKITYDISDYENIIDYSHLDIYTDERDKINACISLLKEQDQNIFNMFYYSAKSIKEISKELNISEFNVSTRLYRIRKKIQKEFKKEVDYGEQ